MPHAALFVVQGEAYLRITTAMVRFNAARGFVGGARDLRGILRAQRKSFNAARGFVGGARLLASRKLKSLVVSMPHAALFVVQAPTAVVFTQPEKCFNAARGFVGGAKNLCSHRVGRGG